MHNDRLKFLIKKLKNGESSYFNEFYSGTKAAVWYIITRFMRDRNAAEDVMQEVYVSFLNSLYRVDENKNPMSYLLTTARNKTLDEFKKRTKEELTESPEEHGGSQDFSSPLVDFPLLNLCKEKLTKDEYEILELTMVMGYKRVEAAKMLGKPVSTLYRTYKAVVQKAKKLYKEAYYADR